MSRIVDEHGWPIDDDDYEEQPKKTNFDRLKDLDAERVAALFCSTGHCLPKMLDGNYPKERCSRYSNKCKECITDYLHSEVTDDDLN